MARLPLKSDAPLTAADVIRMLDLKPHPEGGHYCQTFRDGKTIDGGRVVSTAIYFLLARGERSHWHRVDAVEIWHWHAGAPLALEIAAAGKRERLRLGNDLAAGERPQGIVPAHAWQRRSRSATGRWSAAPWRRDSSSRRSSWRRKAGSRTSLRFARNYDAAVP